MLLRMADFGYQKKDWLEVDNDIDFGLVPKFSILASASHRLNDLRESNRSVDVEIVFSFLKIRSDDVSNDKFLSQLKFVITDNCQYEYILAAVQ